MARLSKGLRLLFIGCAGVSTFYVAAQWAGHQRESQDAVPDDRPTAAPTGIGAQALAPKAAPAPAFPPTFAPAPAASAPAALGASEPASAPGTGERSRSIPKAGGDLFASMSWLPPPPPPAPPPPPPPPVKPAAPVAPPLPFVFVGMLERGVARPQAFLSRGEALYVVSVGDTLDNSTYRVDSLTPDAIVMTYLPLKTEQHLNISTGPK